MNFFTSELIRAIYYHQKVLDFVEKCFAVELVAYYLFERLVDSEWLCLLVPG